MTSHVNPTAAVIENSDPDPGNTIQPVKTSPRARKLIYVVLASLLIAGIIEVVLNGLCFISPSFDRLLSPPWRKAQVQAQAVLPIIPDDRLVYRPNPEFPEHDARGFRNRTVRDRSAIVTLGDSQTYGTGVARDESWPCQVEGLTDESTYSFAYGGYGPVHGLLQLDDALKLKPRVVIQAFFAGNDCFDAYTLTYDFDGLRANVSKSNGIPLDNASTPGGDSGSTEDKADKVVQSLRTQDGEVLDRIRELNENDPIWPRLMTLFRDYCGVFDEERSHTVKKLWLEANPIRRQLSNHSKLYGLARAAKQLFNATDNADAQTAKRWQTFRKIAAMTGGSWEPFESSGFRTVFVPRYNLCTMDLSDGRINEGHQVALRAIARTSERVYAAGARFVVLKIPTKLLVFDDLVARDPDQVSSAFAAVVENEKRMWQRTESFLRESGIEVVDGLPALRQCLTNGEQPFRMSGDGHMNAIGHRAIARQVQKHLQERIALNPK